jgi:hypothetical protein
VSEAIRQNSGKIGVQSSDPASEQLTLNAFQSALNLLESYSNRRLALVGKLKESFLSRDLSHLDLADRLLFR